MSNKNDDFTHIILFVFVCFSITMLFGLHLRLAFCPQENSNPEVNNSICEEE